MSIAHPNAVQNTVRRTTDSMDLPWPSVNEPVRTRSSFARSSSEPQARVPASVPELRGLWPIWRGGTPPASPGSRRRGPRSCGRRGCASQDARAPRSPALCNLGSPRRAAPPRWRLRCAPFDLRAHVRCRVAPSCRCLPSRSRSPLHRSLEGRVRESPAGDLGAGLSRLERERGDRRRGRRR